MVIDTRLMENPPDRPRAEPLGGPLAGGAFRSHARKLKDFITFPLRAMTLFDGDRWGLTSLRAERFDYVARKIRGYCLDIGCGRRDLFIQQFCHGYGRGIDVYRYEGLTDEHIVRDMSRFPFDDASFDSVTFIANLNHVPRRLRDAELAEAYRCLRPGGNIIVTMGNPVAELVVHKIIYAHDRLFGTNYDVDTERGMDSEEDYFVRGAEIRNRLGLAGFVDLSHETFRTQWWLNGLYEGWKR